MKVIKKSLILVLIGMNIFFVGCTTTLREKKATDSDPGNLTQLKLDPQKVKVVHNF